MLLIYSRCNRAPEELRLRLKLSSILACTWSPRPEKPQTLRHRPEIAVMRESEISIVARACGTHLKKSRHAMAPGHGEALSLMLDARG